MSDHITHRVLGVVAGIEPITRIAVLHQHDNATLGDREAYVDAGQVHVMVAQSLEGDSELTCLGIDLTASDALLLAELLRRGAGAVLDAIQEPESTERAFLRTTQGLGDAS